MNFVLDKKIEIKVGKEKVIESNSNNNKFFTVFEDDSDTAWFYACDTSYEMPIQVALHIYNVKDVIDKRRPSIVTILWSADGSKSLLFINNYPHAVVDFERKKAYCRNGVASSESGSDWSINKHDWDQQDFELLYK